MWHARSGKIPDTLYSSYEQQCKRMADDILEGSMMLLLQLASISIIQAYYCNKNGFSVEIYPAIMEPS